LDPTCQDDRERDHFVFKEYNFYRVEVTGRMSSASILSACNAKGLHPVCDYPTYNDGKCTTISGTSHYHYSNPGHNDQYGVPEFKVLGAYFYTGKANGNRALRNRGSDHSWSNDFDENGDAFWQLALHSSPIVGRQLGPTATVGSRTLDYYA